VHPEIVKDSALRLFVCLCFPCLFHYAHAQGDFSKNLKQKQHAARLKLARFFSKTCFVPLLGSMF